MNLPSSPYRGLNAFGEAELDALFFFGRERETELVAANLVASRLTVLYGASGVGKTSILRAGVARELRALPERPLVIVFDAWDVDANDALAGAVAREAGIEPLATVVETVEAAARENDVYLVLDQIEELFLYDHGEDERSVTRQLPELIVRPAVRAHFALGVREDALAQLDVLKTRIPGLLANRLRLDHLDRRAAVQAIGGPIARWNELGGTPMELEPELVELVLDEVAAGRVAVGGGGRGTARASGDGRVETPYLQLVMERLWEVERSEGSNLLRAATLARLGGAARIVRDHLDEALETLTEPEKEAAARMFDHLVTPSGTKISHRVRDLAEFAEATPADVEPVLGRLTELRILRSGGADGDGADRRYEIFHDVLADAVLEWRTRWYAQRVADAARREAEQRRRRAVVVAGIALAGLAVMTIVAIFAVGQRHEAIKQRRVARAQAEEARSAAKLARARALIATAASQLDSTPQQSLVLALRAARLERTPEVGDALREALARAPLRSVWRLHQQGPVTHAAFDPGGRLIATASSDGAVRIWRTATRTALATLRHGSPVSDIAFSGHGDLVATAGGNTVRIWYASTGRPISRLTLANGAYSVAFAPDGRMIAVTGRDRFTRVFAMPARRLLYAAPQTARITRAVFSPTGDVLATTSLDKTAALWDARDGTQLHLLHGHRGPVLDAAFSRSGKLLVTTSDDDEARVWNVALGTKVAKLLGHTNAVEAAAFSPNATYVVTGSDDHDARVWETAGGHPRTILRGHSAPVVAVSFDDSGSRVLTASADGTVRVWDPGTANLSLVGRHRGQILDAASVPGGELVVTAGADDTARIWRLGRRARLHTLPHPASVLAASFSPDGSRVVTACADGSARIWTVATGKLVAQLHHGRGAVTRAVFSPDGRKVATTGVNRLVRIWPAAGGAAVTLRYSGPVTAVSFSPDSRLVLTASRDRTAIWDAATGRQRRTLPMHAGGAAAVFSPSGRFVLTFGPNQDARLWDVATGSPLHTLRASAAGGASFSPDGRWIVTAGAASAGVWATSTGTPLLFLHGHEGRLTGASFAGNGRIVTTGSDGTMRTYRCRLCGPTSEIVALAEARLARVRAG